MKSSIFGEFSLSEDLDSEMYNLSNEFISTRNQNEMLFGRIDSSRLFYFLEESGTFKSLKKDITSLH